MSERPEVRWQTQVKSLEDGIRKIYENKELTDVVFTINGEHHFKAHRLVLAARSSIFQRMLLNTYVPDVILIEDESVTATGFEILLRFIYTNKMDTDDKKKIIEAYLAANYYHQKALQMECERKILSWTITKDDVCIMLDAGLSITTLKDKCLNFIKSHSNEVVNSPSFLEISLKCLSTILHSDVLKTVPVLKRINKIMEWAAKRQKDKSEKVDYSAVREEFLNNTPPLLSKLEFESLKLENLPTINRLYKGLLTKDEVIQFMDYFADKDVSLLPKWCKPVV